MGSRHDRSVKQAVHRLKIIQGQLSGLLGSLEEGHCPEDLLSRSLVIQGSLKSLDVLLFEEYLRSQEARICRRDSEVIKEIKKIYNL